MRMAKKMTGLLLAVCLIVAAIPSNVYAASGRVSFTDLTTEAGVEFDVRVVVTSESDELGSIDINLNYDNELIQFVSGDGITNNGSTLTYSVVGSGTEAETTITFLALKEGSVSITIADQVVTSSEGTTIEMTEGSSAITISGGTEVEATEATTTTTTSEATGTGSATVNDVTYSISNDISESIIPAEYTATTFVYDGATYNGAMGNTSGIVLAYLTDAEGTSQFFCYDVDSSTFYPYVQITVSDTMYIVFLTTAIEETLSDDFVETVLTVNGFTFPTWEDTTSSGFYLIHATNSNGEECIYRYDSSEQTYQRYYVTETSTVAVEEESEVAGILAAYTQWMMIAVGAVAVLLLILIIVLAVKLRNRNLELDDLYDEIEMGKQQPVKEKKKAPVKKTPAKKGTERKRIEFQNEVDEEPTRARVKKSGNVEEIKGNQKVRDEFDEAFEDDFDALDEFDDFDDDFGDDFDDEFAEDYERDLKDEFDLPEQQMNQQPEGRRSIKKASANRKKSGSSDFDDIDFFDL